MLQGESIGVGPTFLNGVNHSVNADAVVENAGASAYNETSTSHRLPSETDPGSKVAQGNPIFRRELSIKLPDAVRNRAMTLWDGPIVVIVRYYITNESFGI